jgi:hypothetical protein
VSLREKLAQVLPPHVIFQAGSPNNAATAMFLPIVSRLLGGDGGAPASHTLECRNVVCRLSVVEDQRADANWRQLLQRDADFRSRVATIGFHGPDPSQDLLTKESILETRVYFRIADSYVAGVGTAR